MSTGRQPLPAVKAGSSGYNFGYGSEPIVRLLSF